MLDYWTELTFAVITAFGSVATAGALGILAYQTYQTKNQIKISQRQTEEAQAQTKLTREEMEITLRPWVGIENVELQTIDSVTIYLKNFGRTPANVVRKTSLSDKIEISRDKLRSGKVDTKNTLLFPNATQPMTVVMSKDPNYLYFGILIEYEYPNNKHGEFGLIGRRIVEIGLPTGNVLYDDMFGE